MSWLLVVPKGGDRVPYLLDTNDQEAMEGLRRDQEIRRATEPWGEAELYDVSPGAIAPARLRTHVVVEVAPEPFSTPWSSEGGGGGAQERDDLGSAALPAPGLLPQRRPRREELLEGKGEVLSGDDTPPEYDPESGERIPRHGSGLTRLGLDGGAVPDAAPMPSGFGPFKRRSD